jgi:hypothetical protein
MNHFFLKTGIWILVAFSFSLMSCQTGTPDANEAGIEVMKDNSLNSKIPVYNSIREYTQGINDSIQVLESKGPVTVEREGQNYEVRVSYIDGEPVLIYTQTPMGEIRSWYYLQNRELVMLRELGKKGPVYYESEFFYEGENLLAAISREAKQSEGLSSSAFQEYQPEDGTNDFRVLPNDAFASAMEFLMGR